MEAIKRRATITRDNKGEQLMPVNEKEGEYFSD